MNHIITRGYGGQTIITRGYGSSSLTIRIRKEVLRLYSYVKKTLNIASKIEWR